MLKILGIDFETSVGTSVHGPDSKDPSNDIHTVIAGNRPDNVHVKHNKDGFNRITGIDYTKYDLIVVHNAAFDIGYIWNDSLFQEFIKHGGKIWCTAQAEYFLTAQRHKFPSLAELQLKYLREKTKESRISRLFKVGIGADRIIASKETHKRVWNLYNKYAKDDVVSMLKIFSLQYRAVKSAGMLNIISMHQKALLGVIMMHKNGMNLDLDKCENTLRDFKIKSIKYLNEATELVKDMWDERLGDFNINSPKHKSAMLFGGNFKIKVRKEDGLYKNGNIKYKTIEEDLFIDGFRLPESLTNNSKIDGRFTTDAKVINDIMKKSDNEKAKQYCKLQKEAMLYGKMCSTYLEPFLKFNVDGKLYPKYNTTQTVSGRLSGSSPNLQNCCSEDTEVLTRRGWVLFPDLTDGEEVYQVDPDTCIGSFVVPSSIIKQKYNGSMVSISAAWGDFLYTPEHRVISYTRDGNKKIELAKDWLGWNKIIDRKLLRSSHTSNTRRLTEAERFSLELAIITQAEGCRDPHMIKNPRYDIRLRGLRKKRQIMELGLPIHKENNGRLRLSIKHDQISEWLDDSIEKNFKPTILSLHIDELNWFYNTLHKWDGDFTRGSTYGQKTLRRKSLSIVQAVASMIGKSTSYYKHPSKDFEVVNFHRGLKRFQSLTEVQQKEYDGNVYCVTVPTGAFMIRRNGAVVVTGNCPASGDMSDAIQGCLVAPEGWLCLSVDFSQLEPFVTALISGDEKLRDDLLAGVCLHCRAVSWIPRLSEGKTYDEIYQLAVIDKEEDWVLKRKKAKGINFKRAYGGGARSLAEAEELDIEDVQAVFDGQEQTYWQHAEFLKNIYENLDKTQKVSRLTDYALRDRAGRKFNNGLELLPVYSKGKSDPDYRIDEYRYHSVYTEITGRRYAFDQVGQIDKWGRLHKRYSTTETKNYMIQGTAADVMQMATCELFDYCLKTDEVKLIRQIHDEAGFYVKKGTEHIHIPKICAIMSSTQNHFKKYLNMNIPFNFRVEAKVGNNFTNLEVWDEGY